MPLTAFQLEVLAVLAANRSEESHFAGGVIINASDDSPRFSRDFAISPSKILGLFVPRQLRLVKVAETARRNGF